MMTWALLVMAVAAQPAPQVEDVVASWKEQASPTESADVELAITRDSRHPSFGAPAANEDWPNVRLRFDRDRRRLDVSRLTVVRRDGRTQAAESDPDRARVEFRNVLIEEELKGPQMVPIVEPATLIIDETGIEKGQKLGPLDRLLAEAPLRATQPLRFLDPTRLERIETASGRPRLVAKQPADRRLEVDVEAASPFRPVRLTQYESDRPAWQIDVTWGDSESRFPTSYFVQTINGSGESLEFVEAKLARVEAPLPSTTDFGRIGPNRDQLRPVSSASVRWRTRVRQAFDSLWLPLAVAAAWGLVILGRLRRGSAVS